MHACELNLRNIIILMIALTPLQLLHAQDCDEECKVNDNVAMVPSMALSTRPQRSSTSVGVRLPGSKL